MSIIGRMLDSPYLTAAVRGTGAAMVGRREGKAEKRKRDLEDEERTERKAADLLRKQINEMELEKGKWSLKEAQQPKAPTFKLDGRQFPDTPEGHKAAREWRRGLRHDDGEERDEHRAPPRPRASSGNGRAPTNAGRARAPADTGPGSTSGARSRKYWQDVATTLVHAHGGDPGAALNEAANSKKNPDYRRARQEGQLRPEFFHAAANKLKAKSTPKKGNRGRT